MSAHDELARDLALAREALDAAEDIGADIWRITGYGSDPIRRTLARVEAELARLTAETAPLQALADDRLALMKSKERGWQEGCDELKARAEAAEQRVAQLEDGLRSIQAIAVMSYSEHARTHRLDWLREIEDRARSLLSLSATAEAGNEVARHAQGSGRGVDGSVHDPAQSTEAQAGNEDT